MNLAQLVAAWYGPVIRPFSRLWLDLETYSEVPITHGTHAYAEKAEVLLFAYALDDEPAQVIDLTAPGFARSGELFAPPVDPRVMVGAILHAAIQQGAEVWAHNSHFDRTVLRWVFGDLCPPVHQWRDTMVQALAHSLPGKLDTLCAVLKVPTDKAKDKRGKQLIQLFCKPLAANRKLRRATRDTHPADWALFVDYARLDIEAMRVVQRRAPKWNYPDNATELALWHLDQTINDRGVAVDLELAQGAVAAVAQAQGELALEVQELTGGAVRAATQRDALLAHLLEAYGVLLDDLRGSTVERLLGDPDIDEGVKELLRVRQQASTSSTAKYKALLRAASSDRRLRGLLQFNGAARTGRWAGRTFQPQNLPRPTHSEAEIAEGIEAIKAGCADLITDNVMALTSSAIRGCLIAPPGRKLVVSDLSNIEGRGLAWLAGEQWKLQAFRDFDAGTGFDLYALAYAKSFNVSPQVVMDNKKHGDGNMRQIGKVQELALGYQGGVGAFVTFAAVYGIDLDTIAASVLDNAPGELVDEARDFHDWLLRQDNPNTYGLAVDTFVACDVIKRGWRAAHSSTVTWWAELEEAARAAVSNPGVIFQAGTVTFARVRNWLTVTLPSGRLLCYPSPQVDDKGRVSYMGVDQYTRKWSRITSYGGKWAENITQGFARDCMAVNMPAIEAEGFQIVLSVHDELPTETPDLPEFSSDRLSALMSRVPRFAPGLPLAAAGFETYRYKKD